MLFLGAVSGSGCATVDNRDPEAIVGERVMQQMRAFMDLDYDLALGYMTPGYQQSPRAERFQGEFSGSGWWQDVTLKSVDCGEATDATRCSVRVIIMMMRPPAVRSPLPMPYDMTWVKLDGQWFHYR